MRLLVLIVVPSGGGCALLLGIRAQPRAAVPHVHAQQKTAEAPQPESLRESSASTWNSHSELSRTAPRTYPKRSHGSRLALGGAGPSPPVRNVCLRGRGVCRGGREFF